MSLKGVHLTDRDIAVLKYLAYGPAFSGDLHSRFFVQSGKLIARRTFESRLKKLKDTNHIRSINPQRIRHGGGPNHGPVYVLMERGLEALTCEGVGVDQIRLVNLDTRSLVHEIILTRVIRKIYELDGVRYQVIRLYDDVMLSKLAPKRRMQRIPDLRFTVQLKNGTYFTFCVEVDAGTTHGSEFLRKPVAFLQGNRLLDITNGKEPLIGTMVVCDTEDRMRYLQHVVKNSTLDAHVKSTVVFNTVYNLDNSLGLFNPWYRPDGTRLDTIFKNKHAPLKES